MLLLFLCHLIHVLLLLDLLAAQLLATSSTSNSGGLNLTAPLLIPKPLLLCRPNTLNAAITTSESNILVVKLWRIGIVRRLFGNIRSDSLAAPTY